MVFLSLVKSIHINTTSSGQGNRRIEHRFVRFSSSIFKYEIVAHLIGQESQAGVLASAMPAETIRRLAV